MKTNFRPRTLELVAYYVNFLIENGINKPTADSFFNTNTGELCDDLCEEDPDEIRECAEWYIANVA